MFFQIKNRDHNGVIKYSIFCDGNCIGIDLDNEALAKIVLEKMRDNDIVECHDSCDNVITSYNARGFRMYARLGPKAFEEFRINNPEEFASLLV